MRARPPILPRLAPLATAATLACGEVDPGGGEPTPRPPLRPWFEERAAAAGLSFRYASGHDGREFLFPEIMGGGVALVDVDGDGLLDVYFVQGGTLRRSASVPTNRLFRNDGRGAFEDFTERAGAAAESGYGMGVTAGDYDGDGDSDLYVTNLGADVLLENDGGGRFEDVSSSAGVADSGWGTGAAFLDFDRDGLLDLFVTNYVSWSPDRELACFDGSGARDYCSPLSYNRPAPDVLYRNRGDGVFDDVSEGMGLRTAFGNGLGVTILDFDEDGFPDVFVANDQTPNQLWHNRGGHRFADVAIPTGCAVGPTGQAKAGMGVEAADVDGDLDEDLLVVNLQAQTDSFFRNRGGWFSEETALVGLAGVSRSYTRFGVGLRDLDNDGWLDLYQANGRVTLPESRPRRARDPFAEPNLLLRGVPPGAFEPVEPAGGTIDGLVHTSRAAAFGDLDNDGGVDIVVVNRDGPAYLLHNRAGGAGSWIGFRVLGRSGADALGASLVLRTSRGAFRRRVRVAHSYLTASDARVHIGLPADASPTDVTVRWPDGEEARFDTPRPGRYWILRRSH